MASCILVINDDSATLALYRILLEEAGYKAHMSRIIFDDVHDVEELEPALIILDIRLEAQTQGLALLQQLKMYRPTARIPVLLCAASVAIIREQEGFLRSKSIPVLYKPFEIEELLGTIEQCLTRSEGWAITSD